MWIFYGTESPTNFNNPIPMHILDFVESDRISVADFNNVSNTWICYEDTVADSAGNFNAPVNSMFSYADVKLAHGGGENLIHHNRLNIVHPKWIDNVKSYFYDGCAYTWRFVTAGTNIYYLTTYSMGTETWSYTPAIKFTEFIQNDITQDMVVACYLVGTPGNSASGIEAVRPLFGIDLSSVRAFQEHPIQYYLGPIIPKNTISEWLKGITINSPNKPNKPTGEADEVNLISSNYSWLNSFKIMNFDAVEAWPDRYLIDLKWYTDNESIKNYFVWNDVNDPQERYHYSGFITSAFFNSMRAAERLINLDVTEVGSSIGCTYKVTDEAKGYWCSRNDRIDDFPLAGAYTNNMPSTAYGNIFKLDWTSYSYDNVRNIVLSTSEFYFSILKNYPNATAFTNWLANYRTAYEDLLTFGGVYILRRGGHFYLGGMIKHGYSSGSYGFAILCRIDNLDELENYDGPNPEDPADTGDEFAVGISGRLMSQIFGPGDGSTENASSDSVSNNYLGDAPDSDDDGSAYNPDGTPRDPADDDGDGTGEKNTHPVDNEQVVNHHDGSMGNGTGDPHDGDTEISDPETSLPTGVDVDGTVSGSGVLSVFTPTTAQLSAFTSELLSNTVLDSIKNFFTTNPMDGIFGLHILPYTGFSSATTANPRIGTHTFTATMNLASDEYITVDYGTIFVPFVYDGYENYAPQSDAKIFLPFIGMKDIDINLIQGCYINLKYNISLVTGDIYAYLYSQWAAKWAKAEQAQGVNHLVYHWQGNCAATVPLSHLDSTNYISGAMQVAGGITSLVAGAATANPFTIPAGVSGVTNGVAEMGRTSIITSGNVSGMAAFMGCREAYLLISRPIMAYNASYRHYLGQRSNAIELIGQLAKGTFTQMRNVDLSGVMATGDELNEIESILKGGFYI